MESTLKIDTSSRGIHQVPIIKIVQPIKLIEPNPVEDIDDVKDKLIREFLHTPCMANRNHFFRTDSHFPHPLENPRVFITTISAVEEGQMFHTFKHAIFERLISYENLCECIEFDKRSSDQQTNRPAPFDWDKYLKIKEFFDWVWEQPYNGDPVNTPIETRRDTKPSPKLIPMETIRDYFELSLEQGERINAFENTPKINLDKKVENMWDAIHSAFSPENSPQGVDYWQKVINRVDNIKS